MQTKEPWYISLRAEALAIVHLTDRDDLIVSQQQNQGLDLLVTITKDGNYSGRIFGVEVKATASSSELIQHNDIFKPRKNKFVSLRTINDLPFPVCLFFFTLDNDQGYYQWILEPIIEGCNQGQLKLNENYKLKKLNAQEISQIISLINHWYDHKSNLR